MSSDDATRERFARSADCLAALNATRIEGMRSRIRGFIPTHPTERVLDVGTGTGTLAFAIAPLVQEVIGVDLVPEMLAKAKESMTDYPNVTFADGDCMELPYEDDEFDLSTMSRTIHHLARLSSRWPRWSGSLGPEGGFS